PYNVVGVLGNNLASFAQAQNVEVDSAYQNYGVYTNPWSKEISVIGYDWKTHIGGGVYAIPDSNTFFIKTTANSIYQMQFLNYVGSNGNFVFRKRLVIPTKVNDLSAVNQYAIFPNPTQGNLNVVLDIQEKANAILNVTDFSGRVVYSKNIQLQQGLNALLVPTQSIANGQYIVNIQGENIKMSEKVIVAK
ncbi:MAG: T9SS type A sorting domain-containing protein, partial [Chitinophagaceae bacterium]|nr:T9SS type A sorting domain-containing protein [Chitinophagaceae bacterium]